MFTSPRIDDVTLRCPRLPSAFDGLQILHLSDLHVTNWTRRLTQWQDLIKQTTPDLIAITGDLGHRSWMWKKALPTLERFLAPLHPPLGTFFILGNHDSAKLGHAFITPQRERLDNQNIRFESAGQTLALIGLNQHRRIDTDIPAALHGVEPDDFKLMLLHYPDLIHAAVSANIDVCLAGHTHGGQICYPDGSPILRHDVLDPAQCTGIHQVRGTWMVVNRGIGVAGIRVRVFCPPQIILLTLRSGESKNQRRLDVSQIKRLTAPAPVLRSPQPADPVRAAQKETAVTQIPGATVVIKG
jgi:predicted MPP superfamily phosphohydrolase